MNIRCAVFAVFVACSSLVSAGMPSPMPEDIETIARLTEQSVGRLQAISFFAAGFGLSIVSVHLLWNSLARSSQWLPRISLARSAALVVLWGAMFVIVLTMISGAWELLTPGAWKKSGVTYTLQSDD